LRDRGRGHFEAQTAVTDRADKLEQAPAASYDWAHMFKRVADAFEHSAALAADHATACERLKDVATAERERMAADRARELADRAQFLARDAAGR